MFYCVLLGLISFVYSYLCYEELSDCPLVVVVVVAVVVVVVRMTQKANFIAYIYCD